MFCRVLVVLLVGLANETLGKSMPGCNAIRSLTPNSLANVVDANVLFSDDLYPILAKEESNVLYSPISAHTILSLLYQGATGETAKNFENTLHLCNAETTAEGYQNLLANLNPSANVTLDISNRVFVRQQSKLKEKFRTIARRQFSAWAENIFFGNSEAAAERINDWVEKETNKKITDLIKPDDLSADTRSVLVNAIYFIGNWLQPFKPVNTTKEKFYSAADDAVSCDMMHLRGVFAYKEDKQLDAQIITLPYKDPTLALAIILPKSKNGITQLEKKLSFKNVLNSLPGHGAYTVNLALPRFKIEAGMDLRGPLTELDLGIIFTPLTELTEIVESESLIVDKAIQKTFIEVNEEGTEGASSSAIENLKLKAPLQEVVMTADHPFIFALTYKKKEGLLPLFIGKLVEP